MNKLWISVAVLGIAVLLAAGLFMLQQQKNPAFRYPDTNAPDTNTVASDSNADRNSSGVDLNMENIVEKGDTIKADYRGTLDDGNEFDSSLREGRMPLEFAAGAGNMIKGFDAAVIGMKLGEDKNIHILPSEAYGEVDPGKIVTVSKDTLGGAQLFEGMSVQTNYGNAKIVKVNADSVELDFNHPLAGKPLNFWIKIVEIKKKK